MANPPPAARPPAPVHTFTTSARPTATPAAAPVELPIPATELLKKPAVPAGTNAARFALAVVDGPAQGQRFRLAGAGFALGRSRGAILFPDDPFISAHHATFTVRDGKLFVRDENSSSGVFVTIQGPETVPPNSFFSTGSRLFRYVGVLEGALPSPGRPVPYGAPTPSGQPVYGVEEILVGGRPGRAIASNAPLLTIGQARCDFAFPAEPGLALRHCEISPSPTAGVLRDLSGGLGTWVRLSAGVDRPLGAGDRLRVGEQVLQVETLA